jgi:IS5 family transposase
MTDDFFRNRLDQMIDLRHPLAVLANRMPWQEIGASLAQRWPTSSAHPSDGGPAVLHARLQRER